MRRRHLEMVLQGLAGFPEPSAALEQYQTPATLASRLLFDALMKNDIAGRSVCDLGCGTGILAIGAALLGAERVIGVDIDRNAVTVGEANAERTGAEVGFVVADVRDPTLPPRLCCFDTVLMNPPFGAQKLHADRPFIDLALSLAPVVYGIFNAGSVPFIMTYTEGRAEVDEHTGGIIPIRRTFSFHSRDVQDTGVEILRLIRCQKARHAP